MKRIKYIFTVLAILFLSACSDSYFDVNQNPNSAIEKNMTPDLLLPSILDRYAAHVGTGYAYIQHWLGYFSRSGGYGSNLDIETYAITSTFKMNSWNTPYSILKNVDVMEKRAQEKEFTAYVGVAKILKALGFSIVVDQYNNCPYTEAFDPTNLTPAYDDAKTIYANLIKLLAEADKLLKDADVEKNFKFAEADIMFKGDLTQWRKLGNTIRLRLLIHESSVLGDGGLKSEVNKIVANGAGFLGSGESATVNPNYKKDNNKQNPYWDTHYKGADGKVVDKYHRANDYFLTLLRENNDIRYKYFLRPNADGDYVGIIFGETDQAYKDEHTANSTSMVAGPGIAKDVSQGQWLLPSFESMFLQAEAVQRGALPGDPKVAYEAAVKESFLWLEVGRFANIAEREEEVKDWQVACEAEADAYLNSAFNDFAVWDKQPDKLNLILTQKYIAMFGINALEVWTDYRRTGIPDLPLSVHPNVSGRKIPKRLIYPPTEYEGNKTNVLDVDPQKDKIFWDK